MKVLLCVQVEETQQILWWCVFSGRWSLELWMAYTYLAFLLLILNLEKLQALSRGRCLGLDL